MKQFDKLLTKIIVWGDWRIRNLRHKWFISFPIFVILSFHGKHLDHSFGFSHNLILEMASVLYLVVKIVFMKIPYVKYKSRLPSSISVSQIWSDAFMGNCQLSPICAKCVGSSVWSGQSVLVRWSPRFKNLSAPDWGAPTYPYLASAWMKSLQLSVLLGMWRRWAAEAS